MTSTPIAESAHTRNRAIVTSRGGWKEVIIRSRAGSNDLLDLCAFVNCMHERTCLITFFAFQNLAQLSQLSSAQSLASRPTSA